MMFVLAVSSLRYLFLHLSQTSHHARVLSDLLIGCFGTFLIRHWPVLIGGRPTIWSTLAKHRRIVSLPARPPAGRENEQVERENGGDGNGNVNTA